MRFFVRRRRILLIYLSFWTLGAFVNYRYFFSDESGADRSSSIDQVEITDISPSSISSDHYLNRPMIERVISKPTDRLISMSTDRMISQIKSIDPSGQKKSIADQALWPEESNRSDRILSQMDLTLEAIQKRSKKQSGDPRSIGSIPKLIYLPHGVHSWYVRSGQSEFVQQGCKIANCRLIDSKSDSMHADAVVFRNSFLGGFERTPNRSHDQIWIYYALESPHNTPSLVAMGDRVNWTATYRFDSDLVAPYEKFRTFSPEEVSQRNQSMITAALGKKKSKHVAWFVSNCHTSNRRHEYAQSLARYIPVDIYGRCGPLKCSRTDGSKCGRLLDEEYRFYLAFENSNCRDYITEKFFVQGLQHNVIPIVMGARKSEYERSAPPHSFIHVDDFRGPRELAAYLRLLSRNETLYNEYFRWKFTGEFMNTKFWCRLCAMLHDSASSSRRKNYPNIDDWWRGSNVCLNGRWDEARNETLNKMVEEELRRIGGNFENWTSGMRGIDEV